MKRTSKFNPQAYETKKQEVYELIKSNKDGITSFDIEEKTGTWSIKYVKIINNEFFGPLSELEMEGLIYYDKQKEKWFTH